LRRGLSVLGAAVVSGQRAFWTRRVVIALLGFSAPSLTALRGEGEFEVTQWLTGILVLMERC